ncbi:hypothetical protein BDGGKGIB_01946 [Nodularia sphaerocarpa UHCC 0038]|nr:hypothetical protein BDGGKGIB_01946 [Nodularia sphaerocarpa UHCC 0038]
MVGYAVANPPYNFWIKLYIYFLPIQSEILFGKTVFIYIGSQTIDTPRDKSTGILGSTKPLNLESLRRLNQRWDSPQALIRVCPTLFA